MHFITAGGREYEILKRLPTGEIQIKDIVTNECLAKSEQDIINALFANEIELLGHDRNQVYLKELLGKTKVSDITLLDDNDPRRGEMQRRRAYVLEVVRQRLNKLTEGSLKPVIEKVGRASGDIELADYKKLTKEEKTKVKPQPSVSSLTRWVNKYIKAGEDERALVPATKSRGNRNLKFSGAREKGGKTQEEIGEAERARRKAQALRRAERVGELVDEAIDEVYMSEQRFSVQDVYDAVVVKVADENEFRTADDQLPEPHKSSIYDVVNKLDDYEVLEARYGEEIAEQKYKAFKLGPRPTMPLQRVEADHTKIDLFAIDPIMMLPIGRPILTWLVCVFTKMILGFYISFNPYGSLAIMECLKHAIRPKNYVREKYPDIRHTWGPYGVPKELVLDNAPEFWGRHLDDACHDLGMNVLYGQKGRAWYRATVERSYRSYNTGLIHRQPGTTFSNIFDLADYDPKRNALITFDTLDHITHKYIIDVLQCRPHRGINDIPALRWEKGIQQWPPSLPANARNLDIVLGYIERRQIHHYGIEIDAIIYNDEGLTRLRSESEVGKKHIIKRNPSNLSLIHVYDEKHDRFLPVPAVDQEYTKGLTLYQHTVIRRYVRERLKRNVDIVALCRAKMEIQEIVERDWNRAKSSRVKMARWRNEGVQDRREGFEITTDKDWVNQVLGISAADKRPLLMSPEDAEKSRRGVSDLASAFDMSGNAIADRSHDEGKTVSGFIGDGPTPKKVNKKESRQLSKSVKGKKVRSGSDENNGKENRSPGEEGTGQEQLCNEGLDMTGWNADYDLPN
ncbi:MAG TPA: Mu transposase C-terminal domain-containing protein [Pyrinomonadaceae bacterium]|jgi:putative transposase